MSCEQSPNAKQPSDGFAFLREYMLVTTCDVSFFTSGAKSTPSKLLYCTLLYYLSLIPSPDTIIFIKNGNHLAVIDGLKWVGVGRRRLDICEANKFTNFMSDWRLLLDQAVWKMKIGEYGLSTGRGYFEEGEN